MNRSRLPFLLIMGFFALWLTACSGPEAAEPEMPMEHDHEEPPEEFASLLSPFSESQDVIEAGAEIFKLNCATCHGLEGGGDGPAAAALDPKPATLADSVMMLELSDGYLFWRVSKGGQVEPFDSAMPAWEAALTEDQRWQVIAYIRTLADGSDDHPKSEDHSASDSDSK